MCLCSMSVTGNGHEENDYKRLDATADVDVYVCNKCQNFILSATIAGRQTSANHTCGGTLIKVHDAAKRALLRFGLVPLTNPPSKA